MIIKRFFYFKPTNLLIQNSEPYTDIHRGTLHGRLYQREDTDKIIFFCHGNGGNLSHREQKISELLNLGFSVLIFDYSGYGMSTGVPTEQQCCDDAAAWLSFLLQTHKKEDVIIYGESLGGAIALYVGYMFNMPYVILESSIVSMKEIIKTKYPLIKPVCFLFPEFDTLKLLKQYKGDVLVLHSLHDDVIFYVSAEKLKPYCSEFVDMEGTHNNPKIPFDKIKNFIYNKDAIQVSG